MAAFQNRQVSQKTILSILYFLAASWLPKADVAHTADDNAWAWREIFLKFCPLAYSLFGKFITLVLNHCRVLIDRAVVFPR